MKRRNTIIAAAVLVAAATTTTAAMAGWFDEETPPANAKPLSGMIRSLEDRGFTKVTEVDYDDGVYDIEVHLAGDKEQHFKFNAVSGQEVH